jgi:glutathione synthase/RimK-type ligase-like ATP-grasp enzyme
MRVFVKTYQRDVSEYTLVHFKTSVARDLTAAIARYARSRGVKVIDLEAIRHFPDMSKLYQYAVLSTERLRVPDSIFMLPFLGLPFVLKGIHASKGDVNNVVRSEEDFILIAQEALTNDVMLVGQKFVHNKGDHRILVFGKRITLVIHRVRKDDSTHLNNTSAGGTATIVPANDLPPQVRLDSLRAAEVLGRTIAGVDAILDEEKQEWLFLEVNDGPQLATGSFLPEKHEQLAKYFLREVGK